jgi:hypothetical protein
MGGAAVAGDFSKEDDNRALVCESFGGWESGADCPSELPVADAERTIVGSSRWLRQTGK